MSTSGRDAPVPLVRQAWLRKKNGAVAAVPRMESGNKLRWRVVSGKSVKDVSAHANQTGAGQAVCVACGTPAPTAHVKDAAMQGRMGESLAALVIKRKKFKLYLSPDSLSLPPESLVDRLQSLTAELGTGVPTEALQGKLRDQLPSYGVERHSELYTPRQLLVLFTLIKHIRAAHGEMLATGMEESKAKALVTYLAMAFSRFVVAFNKFTRWESAVQRTMAAIGDRQAIKMVYDFSEINCLAETQGCLPFALDRELFCIAELANVRQPSTVTRGDAGRLPYILWRFTYRESSVEAGDVYVFSYPQGIEIDGPSGLAGPSPSLVEKEKSKFRVRDFQERGDSDRLGIGADAPAPLVDVIHRMLWLLDNRPADLQDFLRKAQPNQDALRLATQALCAPVFARSEAQEKATEELAALSKLNANWRPVVEGAAFAQGVEGEATGQAELALGTS